MGTLLQDLRYGARMLARTPGATLVSLASVALGVGATTVIFTLVNALLLRPLPVADPGSLVTVVALLASYLPARRATRVDPMVALRAD